MFQALQHYFSRKQRYIRIVVKCTPKKMFSTNAATECKEYVYILMGMINSFVWIENSIRCNNWIRNTNPHKSLGGKGSRVKDHVKLLKRVRGVCRYEIFISIFFKSIWIFLTVPKLLNSGEISFHIVLTRFVDPWPLPS